MLTITSQLIIVWWCRPQQVALGSLLDDFYPMEEAEVK